MGLASLIPSVFYDLIARLVPGFVIIASTYVAYMGSARAVAGLSSFLRSDWLNGASVILVVLLTGVASYVLAMLLSGIAYCLGLRRDVSGFSAGATGDQVAGQAGGSSDGSPACGSTPSEVGSDPTEALHDGVAMYDLIRWAAPDVGDRLAKVRAECRLCEALITGWVMLAIASPFLWVFGAPPSHILGTECVLWLCILAASQQRRRLFSHLHRGISNYHRLLCTWPRAARSATSEQTAR